ncbi:hypothetical protein [Niallia sp. 01092]|uniref:hypothetical protein n=1 Tax=unclassified Niallia TaxID=2837522 RepID=UPI003FD466A9
MVQVTLDVYQLIRKGGNLLQYRINTIIKNKLNNENLILLANNRSKALTKKVIQVQNHVERLASILHLPTKTDVSNATQLILQSEEKIDSLDEQLYELTTMLQEIQQHVKTLSTTDNPELTNISTDLLKQKEGIEAIQQDVLDVKEKISEQKQHSEDNNDKVL